MIHRGRVRLLLGHAADINTQVRTSQANAGALMTWASAVGRCRRLSPLATLRRPSDGPRAFGVGLPLPRAAMISG
jgi:hypothetical protein